MNSYTLIENGVLYTPMQVIDNGILAFNDGKIVAVGTRAQLSNLSGKPRQVIDAGGNLVCPGFIDQHLHGGGGADTMDQSYDAICTIAKTHAKFGVTALCPATMAAPDEDIKKALAAVADAVEKGTGGARVLGTHIEGPCMNVEARGAHLAEYVEQTPPT